MNSLNDPVILGRLLILPLAALCPVIVMISTRILRKYPRNLWIRSICTIVLAIIYVGVVVVQMLIFRLVAGVRHVTNDKVVFSIVLFENLIAIGLLFYRLKQLAVSNIISSAEEGSTFR